MNEFAGKGFQQHQQHTETFPHEESKKLRIF